MDTALPPLDASLSPRPAADVAMRVLALTGIQKVINGDPQVAVVRSLKALGAWNHATHYERYVFEAEMLDEEEEDALSWQTESLWILLWALGKVSISPWPDSLSDLAQARHLLVDEKANLIGKLLEAPALRPVGEILDHMDLLFRLYGLAEDSVRDQVSMPANLQPQVIAERYHALRWLMQEIAAWDE